MKCPHCDHENPPRERLCVKCGLPLDPDRFPKRKAPDETRQLDDIVERVEMPRWGSTRLGERRRIVLQPPSNEQAFALSLFKDRLTVGRFDKESGTAPEIDLSRFDAHEKGVSRRHAELVVDDDLLKIVDLNSSNATYVNGQKLVAYQSRILQDGDELRLGHLLLRIYFAE